MKRVLVGLACLTILLAVAMIGGGGLGAAQSSVGPRPTPTAAVPPEGYTEASPRSPDALPDLIVTDIRVSPESPFVNGSATVYVTIKNQGGADVDLGNNFFLDLYINPTTNDLDGIPGDYWWDVQGYLMKAGATAEFQVSLSGIFDDTASYYLWAQVDRAELPDYPSGYVIESDDGNNVEGPETVRVRTRFAWAQQDHVDFFSNMASTLDIVPIEGTVGLPTDVPGLEINGDSALALGIFDEPPWTSWGTSDSSIDYDMLEPDLKINEETVNDQHSPSVHADLDSGLVVVVWEDGKDGATWGRDVYLRWSDDEGETWGDAGDSPPYHTIRVNDQADGDQKLPSVAVAPNGNIVVVWQDNRSGNFDIYVQAFQYNGSTLIRCNEDGDCSADCDPATLACNIRVDTGAADQVQSLPDISVDNDSNFYVAWQDRRNNNFDIFAVRSYYSSDPCPDVSPDLGFLPEGAVIFGESRAVDNLCWGHDARISDDPGTSSQTAPDITALQGVQVQEILYEVTEDVLQVTDVITAPVAYVVATWEDDRENDLDIYMTYSEDGGETFVQDQRLNNDKPDNSTNGFKQQAPAVAINQWMKFITISKDTPYGTAATTVEVPVTTMHIVWQDFRNSTPGTNDDPDIYYSTITVEPDGQFPWPVQFQPGGQDKVNEDDQRAWQTQPVWQGAPDVSATSSGLTLAGSDSYNAFVTWADGRNYGAGDRPNRDIYFRLFSTVGTPTDFVGGNNVMVNNNARLHSFVNGDPPAWPGYSEDMPPHANQRNPSVASTLVAQWPTIFDGWVFVVWDDDRIANPGENYDVYMTRSNMLFGGHRDTFVAEPPDPDVPGQGVRYGSGAFVSRIFDGGSPDTEWYNIDWHAITDDGTYLTLQTRLGNTPEEVLTGDWYPTRYPYPDDAISLGAPLQGYDAPGQHIENSAGDACPDNCPTARYIQYRVNFWARDAEPDPGVTVLNTPFLFDVTLGYEPPFRIYLPVVLRNY